MMGDLSHSHSGANCPAAHTFNLKEEFERENKQDPWPLSEAPLGPILNSPTRLCLCGRCRFLFADQRTGF